ncbi:hypothetical protein [Micromonospora sp. NPDC049679]|uniref:hypothetical protein n=1 Tax=Micromonospora sp. NPDC049679 TaxID=3155920 RepID=UPI0033EA1501
MTRPPRRARMTRSGSARPLLIGVLFGATSVPGWPSTPARAASGDIGFVGPSTSGDGSAATGEKRAGTSSSAPLIILLARDPATRDWSSYHVTTTKQEVTTTGMMVTASNDARQRYWHADLPQGSS